MKSIILAGGSSTILYPVIKEDSFEELKVMRELWEFKTLSDVMVVNRLEDSLLDVKEKVYTSDIFNSDS